MKDRHWLSAHRALVPLLVASDEVLAPHGDWDPFPCAVRFYGATIEVADETVLMLHRGRLGGIAKPVLAPIVAGWLCVYANAVFTIYVRPPRRVGLARRGLAQLTSGRVQEYLASRDLKRLPSTIYHVHLPKTGGTAVWAALSAMFRSSVYYGDMDTLRARPPEPGEYDLVGLHGSPAMIEDRLQPGDLMVGLLREPTLRFLSGIVHSRRTREDVETLTASQRAMRAMRVQDFLATPDGRYEARLQLILLGTAPDAGPAEQSDERLLDHATALVSRDDTLFAPSRMSAALLERLLRRFGLRAPRLERRNRNDPADYVRYRAEFEEAMPLLERISGHEQRLVDLVAARFGGA